MLADTLGRPLRLLVTPGEASDIGSAPALLDGRRAKAVLADKAYDSDDIPASTSIETRSSDASDASSISAVSRPAMTAA